MKMRHALATVAFLAGIAPAAQAQPIESEGNWLLRARTLQLNPGIQDGIGLFITVEPLRFTEVDLTWFFRPQWALEFSLTVPQTHLVNSAGFEVGRLRQLPPTLVLQYHLTGWRLQPYVSAGVSYTLISNLRFSPDLQAVLQPTLRNRSFGPVLGLGVEVPLTRQWSLNVDWKQLRLKTDLDALGPGVGFFNVRPRLASLGIGYRF